MTYRLGVDVGGTFTDLLLIDEDTGVTHRAKTPSTPADQSVGVLVGIDKVCDLSGISPADIDQVLHGTTVATNAVLEGKGATVGLLVTRGYRQVLQVARSFVPGGLAAWIIWPKPEPLAALENTVEVVERVGARGEVVTQLDEADLLPKLKYLREQGVDAVTIALVNSFANPAHERRVAELVAAEIPGVPVSLSSVILPEIREYERTLTTVANSYVRPTVGRYLENLERALAGKGISGSLHVLRSDGGLAGVATATAAPVQLLMSGPAGGVSGALWVARQSGYENLLTFDMGGTSTDVALVQGGKPRIGRETTVGSLNVRASSVDVRTVGAGGGSIAHVPELTKALRVGPQSAGAEPGPAAYGRGGEEPTVTDANVVLGHLPPRLLGGEMTLDVEAARAAVQGVADAMGLPDAETAAAGIVDIVNENMFGALRLVSVQQGYDSRDFALVAFGGAGPLHANALAKLLGSWPVIVPPSPGVLCAYGDATTSLRDESAAHLHPPILGDLGRRGARCARRARRGGGRPVGRRGRRAGRPDGDLPGRRALPRAGLRGPGRRDARAVRVGRPDRGRRTLSTPSTPGCSRSPWTPSTSSSTSGPSSPAARRTSQRRRWPPGRRTPRRPGSTPRACTSTAPGRTPASTTARSCWRATSSRGPRWSPRWTRPRSSCPATSAPSTPSAPSSSPRPPDPI